MTAELPGLPPFRREANDGPITPRRPDGVKAARAALVELVRGIVKRGVDDAEPLLAPALIQMARDIADDLLTHPDLSPSVLAHELNVSVRTLHRAFAGTDESVNAYIRRRRLERARLELAARGERRNVGEIAARGNSRTTATSPAPSTTNTARRRPSSPARSSTRQPIDRSTPQPVPGAPGRGWV